MRKKNKVISLENARRTRKQSNQRPDAAFWDSLQSGTASETEEKSLLGQESAETDAVKREHEETADSPQAEASAGEAEQQQEQTGAAAEIPQGATLAGEEAGQPAEEQTGAAAETPQGETLAGEEADQPAEEQTGAAAEIPQGEALAGEEAGQPAEEQTGAAAETPQAEPAADDGEELRQEESKAEDPTADEDWRDTLAYLETEEKQGEAKRAEKMSGKKGGRGGGKKRGLSGLILLLVLLLAGGGIFALYQKFAPTTKHMDSKEYFEWMIARERGVESEEFQLADDELAVLMNNQVLSETAVVSDDRLYLSYDLVLNQIFTRFYWDTSLERMLFTTSDDTWQFTLDSASYVTKDGTAQYEVPVFVTREDAVYICADFLQQYANMTYEMLSETKHVILTTSWGEQTVAQARRAAAVRFGSSIKQEILTELAKGDTAIVLDQTEKWMRIRTPDGYIGWVQSSLLTEPETETSAHDYTPADYAENVRDHKINLVWHQIGSSDGNKFFTSDTAGMTGVNVISPTWFSLTDNEGNFSSYAEKSYVRKAHNKDMEVWGLVDNFSANMSTAELTANASARAALITNLINAALEVEMDGINIDFETISEEAGHSYVQFIRELSVACRANGLVLSVDVPVPTIYSQHYDRDELGVFCDYVIMMGYDEHYSGSEAGSVASLSFEENGIRDSLTEIPAKKLISAVPFYTRLWYTLGDSTWSEAYGMNTIATTIDTYDVETVWNEETQQNYAEWTLEDGTLCRIWVEDEKSLALKAALVKTYELGGIAEWALGFERSSVWSVLTDEIGT